AGAEVSDAVIDAIAAEGVTAYGANGKVGLPLAADAEALIGLVADPVTRQRSRFRTAPARGPHAPRTADPVPATPDPVPAAAEPVPATAGSVPDNAGSVPGPAAPVSVDY